MTGPIPLAASLLAACQAPAALRGDTAGGPGRDSSDTGPADTGPDTGPDTGAIPGDPPRITSCDASCYHHEVGDQYYQWNLQCSVTDPDGAGDIWQGRAEVLRDEAQVADYLVVCDRDGNCGTSFKESEDGVLCERAQDYLFRVVVEDWEGHASEPFEVRGRRQ